MSSFMNEEERGNIDVKHSQSSNKKMGSPILAAKTPNGSISSSEPSKNTDVLVLNDEAEKENGDNISQTLEEVVAIQPADKRGVEISPEKERKPTRGFRLNLSIKNVAILVFLAMLAPVAASTVNESSTCFTINQIREWCSCRVTKKTTFLGIDGHPIVICIVFLAAFTQSIRGYFEENMKRLIHAEKISKEYEDMVAEKTKKASKSFKSELENAVRILHRQESSGSDGLQMKEKNPFETNEASELYQFILIVVKRKANWYLWGKHGKLYNDVQKIMGYKLAKRLRRITKETEAIMTAQLRKKLWWKTLYVTVKSSYKAPSYWTDADGPSLAQYLFILILLTRLWEIEINGQY
ncbi:hypothetical protein JCM33374_g1946 [Metschnikowia sp. JCM 33374]|nr:hypothetical protein JCM33374_g1946 [Metschnikowia sp. JCM 33374]